MNTMLLSACRPTINECATFGESLESPNGILRQICHHQVANEKMIWKSKKPYFARFSCLLTSKVVAIRNFVQVLVEKSSLLTKKRMS